MRVLAPLLLLIVAAIALTWVGWSPKAGPDPAGVLSGLSHDTPPAPEASDPAPEDLVPAEADDSANRVAAPGTQGSRGLVVRGRVQRHPDMPVDDALQLVARQGADMELKVALAPDDSFEVPLSDRARGVDLVVRGRFHTGSVKLDPASLETFVVIEPQPAGTVSITLDAPEGVEPDFVGGFVGDARLSAQASDRGTYELRALLPEIDVSVRAEYASWVDPFARKVQVHAGHVTEVRLEVIEGARLLGRVVNEGGQGVADALVAVDARLGRGQLGVRQGVVERRTRADGAFDIPGVPPGWLQVTVKAEGYVEARLDLDPVVSGERREDVEVTLTAAADGVVAGTLRWPDGSVPAQARVRAVSIDGRSHWNDPSVRDGTFRIEGLPPGSVRLLARSQNDFAHRDGHAQLDAVLVGTTDVALVLRPADRLVGRVVDDTGAALTDFTVTAYSEGSYSEREKDHAGPAEGEAGTFELDGLHDAAWRLRAGAEGHADSSEVWVTIPATSGGPTLVCPRLGSLAGRALDPASGALASCEVEVRGPLVERDWTYTDAEGRFMFDGLPPGPVTLRALPEGHAPSDPVDVTILPGEAAADQVLVARRGASLTGEMHASISDPGARSVILTPHDSYDSVTIEVDAEGRFAADGLAPGRYLICRAWVGDDWVLGYANRAEQPLLLVEGEATHVVIGEPQPEVVHVVGTVHESGAVAAGYTVYVYEGQRGERRVPVSLSRTNDAGVFELDVPRAGSYRFSIGAQQSSQTIFLREVEGGPRVELGFDMPTGAVRGTLLYPDARPAAGRRVSLTLQDAPGDTREFGELRMMDTDERGAFEAAGLAPGSYRLRTTGVGMTDSQDPYALAVRRDVVVVEGEVTEVRAQLGWAATIAGSVHTADGNAVPGATVVAIDAAGEPHRVWYPEHTDASGAFRLVGVPAGPVTVRVTTRDGRSTEVEAQALAGDAIELAIRMP